jgi:hypothetical protein
LSTFLVAFSSASGAANGTRAPTGLPLSTSWLAGSTAALSCAARAASTPSLSFDFFSFFVLVTPPDSTVFSFRCVLSFFVLFSFPMLALALALRDAVGAARFVLHFLSRGS